jgi:hypothetical protein
MGLRTLCLLVLAFITSALGPARAEEVRFLSGAEDLPLMPGLVEVPGESVTFDTPEGRLIEALAEGAVTVAAVESFYDQTLPQLGWSVAGPRQYLREGEYLHIEFSEEGEGRLGVRFSLSPAPR